MASIQSNAALLALLNPAAAGTDQAGQLPGQAIAGVLPQGAENQGLAGDQQAALFAKQLAQALQAADAQGFDQALNPELAAEIPADGQNLPTDLSLANALLVSFAALNTAITKEGQGKGELSAQEHADLAQAIAQDPQALVDTVAADLEPVQTLVAAQTEQRLQAQLADQVAAQDSQKIALVANQAAPINVNAANAAQEASKAKQVAESAVQLTLATQANAAEKPAVIDQEVKVSELLNAKQYLKPTESTQVSTSAQTVQLSAQSASDVSELPQAVITKAVQVNAPNQSAVNAAFVNASAVELSEIEAQTLTKLQAAQLNPAAQVEAAVTQTPLPVVAAKPSVIQQQFAKEGVVQTAAQSAELKAALVGEKSTQQVAPATQQLNSNEAPIPAALAAAAIAPVGSAVKTANPGVVAESISATASESALPNQAPVVSGAPQVSSANISDTSAAVNAIAVDSAESASDKAVRSMAQSEARVEAAKASLGSGPLNVEVLRLTRQGGGRAVLEVTPPNQGPIRLDLQLDGAGKASLVVEGLTDAMRARLESSAHFLRQDMASMGLALNLELRERQEGNAAMQAFAQGFGGQSKGQNNGSRAGDSTANAERDLSSIPLPASAPNSAGGINLYA